MLIITPLGVYLWTIIICKNGLTLIWHRGSTRKTLLPKRDQTPAEAAQWSRSPPLGMLRPREAGSWEPSPDRELHHTAPKQPQLSWGLDLAHAWHLQGQAEQPGSLPGHGHGHFIFPLHESKSYKNAPFFFRATESSYYNLSLHYMLRKESYFFHITNYLSKSKMDVAVLGTQDIMTIKRTCQCAPWVCKLKATISLLVCFSTLLHSNPIRPK